MDYVTQPQICKQLDVTAGCIQKRAEKLGISAKRIRTAKSGRLNLYTLEDAIKLGWNPAPKPEEEHPLVTDPRWLKLSNWPETTPVCFQDLED